MKYFLGKNIWGIGRNNGFTGLTEDLLWKLTIDEIFGMCH